MNALGKLKALRDRRIHRTRTKVKAHNRTGRKRIYMKVSNRFLTVQLIDDKVGKTLVAVTTRSKSNQGKSAKNIEAAKGLAKNFYTKVKELSFAEEKFVFDRGSRLYHGKVKAFADELREQGLQL